MSGRSTAEFDLREQPWIPVRSAGGEGRRFGIRQLLLTAHDVEEITVPVPPSASAVMRVLYAVTARVTGLDDPDLDAGQWLAARNEVLAAGAFDAAAVNGYLDRPDLAGRFDLFDAGRPFLQDPRLAEQCPTPSGVNKLMFDRACGNNLVFLSHHHDGDPRPLTPAQAAWALLGQRFYGSSGMFTPRTVGAVSAKKASSGPLRSSVSFHPLGRTLFETLVLGLPRMTGGEPDAEDLCPWEEPELPDPLAASGPVTWPGRLLVGRTGHALLLVPLPDGSQVVDAYVTWGSQQPLPAARDPYTVTTFNNKGSKKGEPGVRAADADRALWRDLDALVLAGGPEAGFARPDALSGLIDIPAPLRDAVRVRVFGFDQQGRPVDRAWFTAVTPPLLGWMQETDPAAASRIGACRAAAEAVADRLRIAAKVAWAEATKPPAGEGRRVEPDFKTVCPWERRAGQLFWATAEPAFWQLLADDRAPHRVFVAAARAALRTAAGPACRRPKGARAVDHGERLLAGVIPHRSEAPPAPPVAEEAS